ncbi:MAG: hypothetical protein QM655_12665 [Nocardioidaceae bacterium]
MTWTKLGSELSDEAASVDLSDAAYRTHVEAIQWLYGIEQNDCLIPARVIRRFAGSPHHEAAITELVNLGWWRIQKQGYEVVHHGDVIRSSIAAQLKKRNGDKERQRRRRRDQASSNVTADVTRDVAKTQTDRQTNRHLGRTELEEGTGWKLPTEKEAT